MTDDLSGAMFGVDWACSSRRFGYVLERAVKIPMSDGTLLDADIWRPDAEGSFPAVLGYHCYEPYGQTGPIRPTAMSTAQWKNPGQERTNASLEAGDPTFFARRGYVHVVCNVRGTGRSEGTWSFVSPQSVRDGAEVVEWIAGQEWSDGNVGMFGVSYFAMMALFVAALQPPALKAIFSPWAATDPYRDYIYRGGMFAAGWPVGWSQTSLVYGNVRPEPYSKAALGEEEYQTRIAACLANPDIQANPALVAALQRPEEGKHPFLVDLLLHATHDAYWDERTLDPAKVTIPAYLGADWANYGLHLPGALRNWGGVQGPKKLLVGPPVYLDRPLYQLQHEAVRWFDHWLGGVDTKIMDEPPIKLFVVNKNEWVESESWPLPQTRFTPFYLHEDNLLSEHEHWSYEGSDSFEDSPWGRGALEYSTPQMVENTEIIGPVALRLYAATTGTDINWIVSLLYEDEDGVRKLVSKGWLKASHRERDETQKPWEPLYTHAKSEPVQPLEIVPYDIKITPIGILLPAGSRLVLRISCVDDPPNDALQLTAAGTLSRTEVSRITVFHNEDHPSSLLLPVTSGNHVNTFFSGGHLSKAL